MRHFVPLVSLWFPPLLPVAANLRYLERFCRNSRNSQIPTRKVPPRPSLTGARIDQTRNRQRFIHRERAAAAKSDNSIQDFRTRVS